MALLCEVALHLVVVITRNVTCVGETKGVTKGITK